MVWLLHNKIAYGQAAQLDKQGNILGERGSVNTINGKSLDMVDVYFQVGNPSIGFGTNEAIG